MILNGANEEAVAAFLRGEARFGQIASTVRRVLDESAFEPVRDVSDVYRADALAREKARAVLGR